MHCLLFLQYGPHDDSVKILPHAVSWIYWLPIYTQILFDLIGFTTGHSTLTILASLTKNSRSHWCFQLLTRILDGLFEFLILQVGDPRLYVCQAPGPLICVSPCGSILGPFWVHFGSIWVPIWGPFFFGSIFGPFCLLSKGVQSVFKQESVFRQESITRQESVFRQECSLDKNSSLDC